jgi:hypothetical protein
MLNQEPKKRCRYCAETILAAAIKCRYCGEMLNSVTVEVASTRSGNKPPQRSFLRQPSSRFSFERVLLYSSWLFVGLFFLFCGILGTSLTLTELLIPSDGRAIHWSIPVEWLTMAFFGVVMSISVNRIVNLKSGTTIIAGITTMIGVLVIVSPLINNFVDPRDNSNPTVVIIMCTVLYGSCLIYATRRLRTLAA